MQSRRQHPLGLVSSRMIRNGREERGMRVMRASLKVSTGAMIQPATGVERSKSPTSCLGALLESR